MSDFRITSLEAKYVGPFEHLSIEFKEKPEAQKDEAEVHIFTGENGTGKSTILYLLTCYPYPQLVKPRIQSGHLTDFKIENKFTCFDNFQKEEILSDLSITFKNIDGRLGFDAIPINSPISKYLNQHQNDIILGHKYNHARFAYSGNRQIKNPTLESIKEITDHPLHDALSFNTASNEQILLQWIANAKSKEALTLMAENNVVANKYKVSLEKLQQAISTIVGTNVKFELRVEPFNVFVIWNGEQTTFEVLPDGLKSIISWLGDLIMRLDRLEWETEMDIFDRNFILFLDEIDIHLHPAWQRKILPVVKKLFKNAQIFISTHSPFVVGSVDGAWVYRLKKEGQYSVLDGEPVLSEDAKSYRLILEEIFGIKEQFGENIEKKLAEFYNLRKEILENKRSFEDETFQNLMKELAPQSIELENILAMELRQLERIQKSKQLQSAL
jgi:predicted ATP-dependent endonuclease of OLD family